MLEQHFKKEISMSNMRKSIIISHVLHFSGFWQALLSPRQDAECMSILSTPQQTTHFVCGHLS